MKKERIWNTIEKEKNEEDIMEGKEIQKKVKVTIKEQSE